MLSRCCDENIFLTSLWIKPDPEGQQIQAECAHNHHQLRRPHEEGSTEAGLTELEWLYDADHMPIIHTFGRFGGPFRLTLLGLLLCGFIVIFAVADAEQDSYYGAPSLAITIWWKPAPRSDVISTRSEMAAGIPYLLTRPLPVSINNHSWAASEAPVSRLAENQS